MDSKQKKKQVVALLIFLVALSVCTYVIGFFSDIPVMWLRRVANCAGVLLLGGLAWLFIRLTGMKPDYGIREGKAYLIGLLIALVLQLLIGVIPALLGQSLVGEHTAFALWHVVYQFFYFMLLIGPVEELIFRVYLMDTFSAWLPGKKWVAVLLSSALFGLWHIINGNLIQVLFTTLIGCVFGFSKLYIKNCKYAGVATAHGLYDFLCTVTTIFLVK